MLLRVSKFTTVAILALSVVSFSGCRSPESRANWVVDKIDDELELDDSQNAKLHDVKNALLEARKRWKDNRNNSLTESKALILSEKLDQAKAKDMLDRSRKLYETEFAVIMPKLAELHATLKPEQKKKFVALIERYEKYMND